MTIADYKDWLKTQISCPNWYAGGLRTTEEKAIVVYNGNAFVNPMAVGGLTNSSYKGKGIRVLVHWNKNIKDSELKAQEVYNVIQLNRPQIENTNVKAVSMRDPEPVYLGVDGSGIYEYVIDFEIIHER